MDFLKKVVSKKETVIDGVILVLIASFLVSYFEPQYLLSKTTTTGGDTGSHYYTAWYLRYHLLPKGQIIGWTQGNYAGFPMLQSYFPLPFLLMAALSLIIPLQIAFKLITVLGTFLLPLCSYGAFRLMRYPFPIPIFGAIFTLPFLFMEANSMWGGNIPSTLAGEFSFSLGMSLSILFLGSFYQGITTGKNVIRNGLLIFLVGFSHIYTLLFSGLASLFFLWSLQDFQKKLIYTLKVHGLGFLLLSVWIMPLLTYLPFGSGFSMVWIFQSFIHDVFPKIFYPFLVFGGISLGSTLYRVCRKKEGDTRLSYLLYGIGVSVLCYLFGFPLRIVDIRFIPFIQILLMLLGALGCYECIQRLKGQIFIPVILYIMVVLWVNNNVNFIPDWIAWNYNGFEKKTIWPQFEKVNEWLRGSPTDGRVVYENSPQHNAVGTPRSFESLPFFSGRSTLEGLYSHASMSAPFMFNIQSEISKDASCPLPQYACARLQIDHGIKHLEMFNVIDMVAISPEIKSQFLRHPKVQRVASFPPYDIFHFPTHKNQYVVPLDYQPILLRVKDWKNASYRWFKDFKNNDVHFVFPVGSDDKDLERFTEMPTYVSGEDTPLPRIPVDTAGRVTEIIRDDEVQIETTLLHKPHLVKISYHPNWKVEGADHIYLASPSFMLIYPTQNKVRLYYGSSTADRIGFSLSLIGWSICLLNLSVWEKKREGRGARLTSRFIATRFLNDPFFHKIDKGCSSISQWALERNEKIRLTAIILLSIGITTTFLFTYKQDMHSLLQRGIQAREKGDFTQARVYFQKVMDQHPLSASAETAHFYYASSYYMERKYELALEVYKKLIKKDPHSFWAPESNYNIGLCYQNLGNWDAARKAFQFVIDTFPGSMWEEHAQARLKEVTAFVETRS